jgi:hypothetical protein
MFTVAHARWLCKALPYPICGGHDEASPTSEVRS